MCIEMIQKYVYIYIFKVCKYRTSVFLLYRILYTLRHQVEYPQKIRRVRLARKIRKMIFCDRK